MQIRKPILDQISNLKHLPTLPHILLKLIKACSHDQGSLNEISKIIEKDPSLTSRILRLVNSAYYGLPRKIENMEQAVAYLGTNAIKNTAICASVFGAFRQARGNGSFNMKLFWWHSLRCAVMARLIARKTRYNSPDEAFLSGLLHDIGRLVLWVNFKDEYTNLLEMYKERPDLLLAGEIRLGATHSEIGAWLLHQWKLQSFMADSILYHHEPLDRILHALPLVQIVYVGNALSRGTGMMDEKGLKTAQEVFHFTLPDIEKLLTQADSELEEVAGSLDIEIQPPGEKALPLSEKDIKTQEELVCEVRDVSLLLGTLQNLLGASEETAILKEIYQGLQILFDLKSVFVFLYDQDKKGLIGKAVPWEEKSSRTDDLFIPLEMDGSLLVQSLRKGRPLDSFSRPRHPAPIILDEQIIRFIGKEGMHCLPMIAQNAPVGVIVLGLDQGEFSQLANEAKLLTMFTNQVALALHVLLLRQSQFQKVQSERLGASSSMARKVVHEVNNPLGIIKNYLKILGMKLAEQNIAQDEIRIINEEIDRVVLILRELTAFSEDRPRQEEKVDINSLLFDLVKITRESLAEDSNIEMHLDLQPSLPPVMADRNALKQVFINLIKNASEAISGGGNLFIQTRLVSPQLGEKPPPGSEKYPGYAEITIRDDGPGIPEEIRSRLFEPFVTSKRGGHAGLGLSVVHNIIRNFNGTITVESDEGKGTRFKIALPLKK